MSMQILLDIDENFKVTEAQFKDLKKRDGGFVKMVKHGSKGKSMPPREYDEKGESKNKRIMLIRTGTGSCTWVKTLNSWVCIDH